jgi:hypothetical protein
MNPRDPLSLLVYVIILVILVVVLFRLLDYTR